MNTFGWVLMGIAVLFGARYVVALLGLRRLSFAAPTPPRYVALTAVPPALAEVLALPAPALEALGFAPHDAVESGPVQCTAWPWPRYAVRWRHASGTAWAEVALAEQPDFTALVSVGFLTEFADGTRLMSTRRRGHELVGLHASVELQDLDQGDLATLWAAHLARIAARDGAQTMDLAQSSARDEARLAHELRAQLCASGLLVAARDGTARFSWRGALAVLRTYLVQQRRLAGLPPLAEVGIDPADPRAPALRSAADERALGEHIATLEARTPTDRGGLLVGTFVLAMLLFAWQYDWTFATSLVVALLLHEGGHLWQMRRAGYRDLRVFFIPLFGAAASGRAGNADAWQRALVLLAGPVPGLVLGCAGALAVLLGHWQPAPWALFLLVNLVALNAFNLLPLVPLDGGRLLELLLFSRHPRLRVAFGAIGAVLLMACALWLETPLLALLGVALLAGLPQQHRYAQLESLLRATATAADGTSAAPAWIATLARHFAAPAHAALRFPQRLALARQIAAHGLPAPPARRTVVRGLAVYVAALALPLVTAMAPLRLASQRAPWLPTVRPHPPIAAPAAPIAPTRLAPADAGPRPDE